MNVQTSGREFRTSSEERRPPLPQWIGCGLVLIVALAFGGGTRQGLWSDAVVQLASLPLLGISLWQLGSRRLRPLAKAALAIAACIVALPLLQLIPFPSSVWTLLPGRAAIAAAYPAAGLPVPWVGISLSPPATLRSALALIPPVAIFIAALLLGRRSRRRLALVLIGFAFASVILGLAQVSQGAESALRFYNVTNFENSVGFFANRNHFAALLYSTIPFTAAFAIGLAAERRHEMLVGLALCLLVMVSLLLGLGISQSRGGLALAILAGFGSMALAWRGSEAGSQRRAYRLIFAASFAGVLLVAQFASAGIMQRLQSDIGSDLRWELARTTFRGILDFLPVGSGFGSFQPVYQIYESISQLYVAFANHAHDDYLEVLLEGGLPAALVLVAFLAWFVIASLGIWRERRHGSASALDQCLQAGASVIVLLLLLHSAVDYPLRTTAMASVFALACAFMIDPLRARSEASSTLEAQGEAAEA